MEIHWRNLSALRHAERFATEEGLRALATGHDDLIDVRISGRESGPKAFGQLEHAPVVREHLPSSPVPRAVHEGCQSRGRCVVAPHRVGERAREAGRRPVS